MKLRNKIMLIIVVIIVIISYVILGYVIMKQRDEIASLKQEDETVNEVQVNPNLIADRIYDENIQIKNIRFETVDIGSGETQEQFEMDLQNISSQNTENKWINIKFIGNDNEELAVIPARIYELVPGETTSIAMACTKDLKQAKDFIIEETEEPENYVETEE